MADVRGPRLAQVVLNLVFNALQAIPPGDACDHRVEVRVRSAGDRALVEVSDTGPGVPAHVAERVFEPFFTTRAPAGGTGLGLWLSRSIVQEEGGTLSWRNRPEGGAIFTVDLPLLAALRSITRRAPSSPAGEPVIIVARGGSFSPVLVTSVSPAESCTPIALRSAACVSVSFRAS